MLLVLLGIIYKCMSYQKKNKKKILAPPQNNIIKTSVFSQSIQFPVDKIKSYTTFVSLTYPVSLGNMSHYRSKILIYVAYAVVKNIVIPH